MEFYYHVCTNIQFTEAYAKWFFIISFRFLRVKEKIEYWLLCVKREKWLKYIYIYFNKIDNHMWVFWKKMLAKIERVDFILK